MSIYFYSLKKQKPMEAVLLYLGNIFTFNKLKVLYSLIIYILAAGVGGFDIVFVAAFSLTIADYVLGFCYGWKTGKIDRQKMKDGVWKFPLYYIAVFSGYKLDEMLPVVIQGIGPIHNFIVIYLGLMEFLSVAEWLLRFNVKLPGKLIEKLESYRDDMNGFIIKDDIIPVESVTETK